MNKQGFLVFILVVVSAICIIFYVYDDKKKEVERAWDYEWDKKIECKDSIRELHSWIMELEQKVDSLENQLQYKKQPEGFPITGGEINRNMNVILRFFYMRKNCRNG